jgi:hypothetical protein
MEQSLNQTVKVFMAGGTEDPRPARNPRDRRFARCVTDNTIVFFSPALGKWASDSGRFHTGHLIEFPDEWLPPSK